jgi:hypothetical protein
MQNMIKRSEAHIIEGNTYKNIYFPKHGHQKKCNNLQRPLFTPTLDLSKHVNKTPIHLVTLPFKEVKVTRWGTNTVDKKTNIFARLSLKFYIVYKHNQRDQGSIFINSSYLRGSPLRFHIPSNRVISSPFSHKTFFSTKLCKGTPYFFSGRKFRKKLL